MLPAPRVIVIDDDTNHLEGLTRGLSRYGAACLSIHFIGEMASVPSCPHARVIFADLHLGGGYSTNHTQNFSMIGGLLENRIKPSGPYLIVLWTMYPEQADKLLTFLGERLQNTPKPFTVQALDKNKYLDPQGVVRNPELLVEAIHESVVRQPRIGALFNWEERVLGAAANTVSSIMTLADLAAEGGDPGREVGRLLASLAVATVGEEHADEDRFRAVNEGLLPILDDQIASMRSREKDNVFWQALPDGIDAKKGLSRDEAARFNRLLHIAPPNSDSDGSGRGAVIDLPKEFSGEAFARTFDFSPEEARVKEFLGKQLEEDVVSFRWVLVQTQAACDYAQTRAGPLPFHLGIFVLASAVRKNRRPPAALWCSPCFEHNDQIHFLHVNARFQVSLPSGKAKQAPPLFRLREQLLNDLIYQIHGYGARPGIISFHESK